MGRWFDRRRGSSYTQSLGGSIVPSGGIVRKISIFPSGAITPSGGLVKKIMRSLAGAVTPSGAIAQKITFAHSLTGFITPSGSISRLIKKGLSGVLEPIGGLIKKITVSRSGSITPSGTTATGLIIKKDGLGGSITPSGILATLYTAGGGILALMNYIVTFRRRKR